MALVRAAGRWARALKESQQAAKRCLAKASEETGAVSPESNLDWRYDGGQVPPHFRHPPRTNEERIDKGESWEAGRGDQGHLIFQRSPYKEGELNIQPQHKEVRSPRDWLANTAAKVAPSVLNLAVGKVSDMGENNERLFRRLMLMESLSAIPGMCGAVMRHLHSLRRMSRDRGWIYMLLQEAECERMHLLSMLKLSEPSILTRAGVVTGQFLAGVIYFTAYLITPKTCHRYQAYTCEWAVQEYTEAIDVAKQAGIDSVRPPQIALDYWSLSDEATLVDWMKCARADEAWWCHVNHTLASMSSREPNPFINRAMRIPEKYVDPAE